MLSVFSKFDKRRIYLLAFNYKLKYILNYMFIEAVSVAQSDARLTGDQEVASSIPAGSGNIL